MQDEKLQGNEKIEAAIDELIVAVEPGAGDSQLRVHGIRLDDGSCWWMAFTSFEEEMKGADKVMSAFMGNMRQLFEAVLKTEEAKGIIVNPWNRTIMLDKNLIRIILGMTA